MDSLGIKRLPRPHLPSHVSTMTSLTRHLLHAAARLCCLFTYTANGHQTFSARDLGPRVSVFWSLVAHLSRLPAGLEAYCPSLCSLFTGIYPGVNLLTDWTMISFSMAALMYMPKFQAALSRRRVASLEQQRTKWSPCPRWKPCTILGAYLPRHITSSSPTRPRTLKKHRSAILQLRYRGVLLTP